ncbi:MAG: hypothetical protein GKC04_08490 [Methanomicrobiales archaeon]|nr:hypothetical protein [Methanomicrobiales archaeon]
MTQIPRILVAGAVVYAAIALVQAGLVSGLWLETGAAAVFLGAVALLSLSNGEKRLKHAEMRILWICVLCFAGYAIARAGGLI